MSHTCQWQLGEESCGKPAVAYISWHALTPSTYWLWYCAVHYDECIERYRARGRTDVLKASGAL